MLGIGFLIFLMSLYSASLSGLQRQMGMVSGDVRASIDTNQFYRGLLEVGGVPRCMWWKASSAVPGYIFKAADSRVELGRELGRLRRDCAVGYILKGNAERGIYTLLKSLRYDQVRLLELEREIDRNRESCGQHEIENDYGIVEAYLSASTGSAYSIIEREYRDVGRLQSRLVELCE
jgi:hypothetical protein